MPFLILWMYKKLHKKLALLTATLFLYIEMKTVLAHKKLHFATRSAKNTAKDQKKQPKNQFYKNVATSKYSNFIKFKIEQQL